MVDSMTLSVVGYQGPGSSLARVTRKEVARVLIRWIPKPQGVEGTSAYACVSPAMPAGHTAVDAAFGLHGTRVSNGTIGRPEGRGGGTG